MARIKLFEETEFDNMHRIILEILKDAGKPLSNKEISAKTLAKYSNTSDIAKWKDSPSAIGNITRYVIIRRLQYLMSGGYIERGQDGRWNFVMEEPLMNEVIRAYAQEKRMSPTQAAKELLRWYIERDRIRWKDYVTSSKECEKIEEESERRRGEILEKMKRVSPLRDQYTSIHTEG